MSTRKSTILLLFFVFLSFISKAGTISDSVVKAITARFNRQLYKLEKVITPQVSNDDIEIPRGDLLPCYTAKTVLIVALFDEKPEDFFGRLLVSKKYNGKIEYDKHLFQDVGYDDVTEVYYSMLNVLFPEESNNLNCNGTVQVYDKKHNVKDIRLLIFTK